jgi:hypothetical protein
MVRCAAAVLVMLCLNPAWVRAQERALTITAASAPVHKSPSAGSPVIGKAARGEAVEVTRDVGDWVKVAWPSDPSGVGYVRASLGTRGRPAAAVAGSGVNRPVPQRAGDVSRRPVAGQIEPPANAVAVDPAVPTARQRSTATTYVARPSHVVGIGARMSGPSNSLGWGFSEPPQGRAHRFILIQLRCTLPLEASQRCDHACWYWAICGTSSGVAAPSGFR